MAVFGSSFATSIAALLASVGQSVTVSRLGSKVCTGYGAFVASKSEDIQLQGPNASSTSSTTKTMLFQGTVAKPPLVGDVVSCSQGKYQIASVSVTNPSGTVIAYKLELR